MPETYRILIVDDSATVRAAVVDALQGGEDGASADLELHQAEDGEEALLRAHMITPHVILMDVQMPRMGGLDALRALQQTERLRDVPVVMLTQADSSDDLADALAAGAHDYVCKPFDPVELRARISAASRTGELVAELRRLNGELDRAVSTDQLTGLASRRAVDRALEGDDRSELVLAVIDIDHFKEVNDTYGHDVGDVVLRAVAERLRDSLRGADVVGRWGGEEFVAILPNTAPDAVEAVWDRVLAAVRRPLDLDQGPARVTISAGVAVRAGLHQSMDALLTSADQALYRAKDEGRDRVVVVTPQGR